MKPNIHPKWHDNAKVTCTCGNSFETGSTLPKIQVEICSSCHPFFTGEMKFIDTQGRVEKFVTKQKKASILQSKANIKKKARKKLDQEREQPKTLREMMTQVKKSAPKTPNKSSQKG